LFCTLPVTNELVVDIFARLLLLQLCTRIFLLS